MERRKDRGPVVRLPVLGSCSGQGTVGIWGGGGVGVKAWDHWGRGWG